MASSRGSFEKGSKVVDRLRTQQKVDTESVDQRPGLTSQPGVLTATREPRARGGRVVAQRF